MRRNKQIGLSTSINDLPINNGLHNSTIKSRILYFVAIISRVEQQAGRQEASAGC